jgi:hypothetical protein
MDGDTDRQQIDQVVDALESGIGSAMERDVLAAVVEADFDRYASTARIKSFVPILVERDVRARILKHRVTRAQQRATRVSARTSSPRP